MASLRSDGFSPASTSPTPAALVVVAALKRPGAVSLRRVFHGLLLFAPDGKIGQSHGRVDDGVRGEKEDVSRRSGNVTTRISWRRSRWYLLRLIRPCGSPSISSPRGVLFEEAVGILPGESQGERASSLPMSLAGPPFGFLAFARAVGRSGLALAEPTRPRPRGAD
jgi:hypothetical protein